LSYKKVLDQLPELELFHDTELNLTMSYRYRKEDNNIPILFLHGFNGNSKSWAYQFNFFKNKRSFIAIDAPGFGQSNPAILDMEAIADMVFRLLKAMNISSCQVVGHSMVEMLAQIISSKYNKLVKKLVLSCTFKGYGMSEAVSLMGSYSKRILERTQLSDVEYGKLRVREMLPSLKEEEEIFLFLASISGEISEGSIKSGGMAMQLLDTTKYLSNIKQKCLIIKASDDKVVSKERSLSLEEEIPHAEIKELSNVGHAPYCEDTFTFNNTLEKFL
jgi:pimeloyl-ACP methyl ester carboxylesterase